METSRAAWNWSPLDWLDWNPILRREAGRTIRRLTTHILLILPVVLTGALVLLTQMNRYHDPMGGSPEEAVARTIFTLFAWVFLLVVTFFAPGMAGSAAISEARGEVGDLLRLTLIRPMGVIFGHWGSVLMRLFLAWLACLPAIFLLNLVGGFSPMEFLQASAIILATACLASAVGLAAVMGSRNPVNAYVSSVFLLLLLFTLGPMLSLFWSFPGGMGLPGSWPWLRFIPYTSPFYTLSVVFSPYQAVAGPMAAASTPLDMRLVFFLAFAGIMAFLFLINAWWIWIREEKRALKQSRKRQRINPRAALVVGRRGQPFDPFWNLILQREMRRSRLAEWRVIVLIVLLGLTPYILKSALKLITMAVFPLLGFDPPIMMQGVFSFLDDAIPALSAVCTMLGLFVAFLVAGFSGAHGFDMEKQNGVLEDLSLTGLSPHTVLFGKLAAALLPPAALLAILSPSAAYFTYQVLFEHPISEDVFSYFLTGAITLLFIFGAATLGTWAAITAKTSQKALMRTLYGYLVCFVVLVTSGCFGVFVLPTFIILASIFCYAGALDSLTAAMHVPTTHPPRRRAAGNGGYWGNE